MEPFLIHGPGSHSDLIEQFFDARFTEWTSAHYWPSFSIDTHESGRTHTSRGKLFDALTFLSYAANNRLSFLTQGRQLQRTLLMKYYDLLCARKIHGPRKLLGWSQVSLRCIQKNKKIGGISVLEHAMPHVSYWMQVSQSFYDDPNFPVKPGYSRFSRGMVKRMLAEYDVADFINVHSSFARQTFLSEGIDPSRIMVTPLGIDASTFPHAEDERTSAVKLRVGYVGRLELFKGLHMIFPLMQPYRKDIEWTLTGRRLPEIEPFLKDLKYVTVTGSLPRAEVSKLLSQTDVLVFPSLNDAFGLVILEAMIHGVPVIASPTSAAPDIISHGEDGYVMDANSTKSIEQGIQWALQNRNRLPEIGAKARKKVLDNYLSHHYFRRFEENLGKIGFTKTA